MLTGGTGPEENFGAAAKNVFSEAGKFSTAAVESFVRMWTEDYDKKATV